MSSSASLVAAIGFAVTFIAGSFSSPQALAQVDSIRPASTVVRLRSIWSKFGTSEPGRDGVGNVVAALPDIDGDGRAEFGVGDLGDQQWRIYGLDALGQPQVLWQRRGASPDPLFCGRFHGDGRLTLGYLRELDTTIGTLHWLELLAVDSGRIADTAYATWHSQTPEVLLGAVQYRVVDLDLDGADELIVAARWSTRNGVGSRNGEIWIYQGGPSFNADTPTVVIRDMTDNGAYYGLHVGRVDEDEYPDLVGVTYTDGRIRWGGPDLRDFDRPVDREFTLASTWIHLLDADGDGRSDLLSDGPPQQVMLHLSSRGKDARERAFDAIDADRTFLGRGNNTFVLGPLNDSAEHYDMFGVNSAMYDRLDLVFSGGDRGPDEIYEATFPGSFNSTSMPAGDIDGNGWRDFICGNGRFDYDRGVAVVIGGGPHIPRDSMPASAIRDLRIEGRDAAISVWPNPATDVVHIAWRGDLHRTPERFVVHDALGRRVAAGAADHVQGEALWRCADRPAGLYLLSIFDVHGDLVATTPIVVR